MVFLLKHTSIFLPVTRLKYHQVAGPPISKICFKMPNHTFDFQASSSRPIPSGNYAFCEYVVLLIA